MAALFAALLVTPFGVGSCGGDPSPDDPAHERDAGDTRGEDAAVGDTLRSTAATSNDTEQSSSTASDDTDRLTVTASEDTTAPNTSTDVEETNPATSTSVETSAPETTSDSAGEVETTAGESSADRTTEYLTDATSADDSSRSDNGRASADTDTTDVSIPPPVTALDVVAAASQLMQEAHFPGMALATFDTTGVTWAVGLGYADSGLERPVTPDTSFWLASVTKPFTGMAILRATEQTELGLDTTITSLLEDNGGFVLASDSAAQVTIADLVTHRSPIRDSSTYLCSYYFGTEADHTSLANAFELGVDCDDAQPVDLGGFLESYLSEAGAYYRSEHFSEDAGEFVHSNVGTALAGYAVELATQQPLATYAREQLFEPLGLEHTSFRLAELEPAEVATPTRWDDAGQTFVDYPTYELATWPEGGLRSSVNDVSKLCAMLLAGGKLGETRVLSTESATTAVSPLAAADVGHVGVFWMLGNDSSYAADGSTRRLAGHNGGDPGAATMVVLDLDHRFGIVILANGELNDQASADSTHDLARVLYRFSERLAQGE